MKKGDKISVVSRYNVTTATHSTKSNDNILKNIEHIKCDVRNGSKPLMHITLSKGGGIYKTIVIEIDKLGVEGIITKQYNRKMGLVPDGEFKDNAN